MLYKAQKQLDQTSRQVVEAQNIIYKYDYDKGKKQALGLRETRREAEAGYCR